MIKLVRIDHRLLHGQVVFSWTKSLGVGRIIIIDDFAATDELKKMSLSLSKPTGVKLNVFTVKDALIRMAKVEALNENVRGFCFYHHDLFGVEDFFGRQPE